MESTSSPAAAAAAASSSVLTNSIESFSPRAFRARMSATVGRLWRSTGNLLPQAISLKTDEYPATFDASGVSDEIDADRSALRLAGLVVEAPVVLGALDDVVHHQAARKRDALVRAQPIGRKIFVLGAAIDRV